MTEELPVILIVEDDLDVADMLSAYFSVQGYQMQSVNWGEDAIRACQGSLPDLIILDIRLPDIDGYEVARRLRTNRRTNAIPIIFLTEKRARADRLHGLELGADDYVTKPFDVQELRLRVRNALRRLTQGSLNNPVTGLPEGALVEERLSECLHSDRWALLLIRLENLDPFREKYGFIASDDVLRAVSLMIHNAIRDVGGPNDFIGQFSPAEFLIVTTPELQQALRERILTRLEQSFDFFYPLKDRQRKDFHQKRLAVSISQLASHQGSFDNIEVFKTRLSKRGG